MFPEIESPFVSRRLHGLKTRATRKQLFRERIVMFISIRQGRWWYPVLSMALLFMSGCATAADAQTPRASEVAAGRGDRSIDNIVQDEYPALVRLYTSIHQDPALSFAAETNSARLSAAL